MDLKKQAILYLGTIAIILIVIAHYQGVQLRSQKKKSATLENTISNLNQKIKLSTIQVNDCISVKQAEVQNLVVTYKNLQSLYGELLKASKTKPKDIQTLVKTQTMISGKDTVLCYVDSFGGLKAHWADEYANIDVTIDSIRQAAIDYSIKDSLTIINYQKTHSILFGLIKWKSYSGCKVITHNPKATPITIISYDTVK